METNRTLLIMSSVFFVRSLFIDSYLCVAGNQILASMIDGTLLVSLTDKQFGSITAKLSTGSSQWKIQ